MPSKKSPQQLFTKRFFGNLKGALALALFRPVRLNRFHVSLDYAVLAIAISLLLDVVIHLALIGPDSHFNTYGIPQGAFSLVLPLIVAYVLAKVQHDNRAMLAFLLLAANVWIIFGTLSLGLFATNILVFHGPSAGTALLAYYFVVAWLFITIFRAIRLVIRKSIRKAIALTAIYVFVTFLPQYLVPTQYNWVANYKESESDYNKVNAEKVFYAQHDLLREALAKLRPQRARVSDIYFVGFGSFAYQDVFMKEIKTIQAIVDERFDTRGRSIGLINNAKTVEQNPLASLTNLSWVLKRLGAVMDVDNDVLLLYLTTHGSSSHKLSVDFWPLQLNSIGPTDLKQALDESGIKWRIIVISACYSGGFVEPLQDEHTIVITSSSAIRQSFGCSTTSDFTYFGRALFDEALRHTHSLTAAFDTAAKRIATQESDEKRTPSEPQIYVPATFESKLKELEHRLDRTQTAR